MKSLATEPQRGEHFFDTRKDGGVVTRTVRNHCSWRSPGQSDWLETKPIIEASVAPLGSLAPMRRRLQASLQVGMGDSLDPDYQCAASACLSEDPNISVTMRPVDAMPSRLTDTPGGIKFLGVWLHATKLYQPAPNKLLGTLRLERPGHPNPFRYSLDVPDGMRIEFLPDENRARILDDQGVERMHVLSPQGWDSSTLSLESEDGRKPVRVTMREAGTIRVGGRTCVVVELEPNKDDLAGAIYPVIIKRNPTVQITGTVDLEDNYMRSNLPTYNWGAGTVGLVGGSNKYHGLVRIANINSIPGGTITGFRWIYQNYNTVTVTMYAYIITDANDWPEGTKSGAEEAGSSNHNQCKSGSQNWAGHPTLGCRESIDDFDADPSPPSITSVGAGWHTFTIKPEWPPLWRDESRLSNGIKLAPDPATSAYLGIWTTEGNPPNYFEIDYEEVAEASIAAMLPRRM